MTAGPEMFPVVTGRQIGLRAGVEAALVFDRNATRLVQQAEIRLGTAQATFHALAGTATDTSVRPGVALQLAIGAQLFAQGYEASCRGVLAEALDALGWAAEQREPSGAAGDWLMSTEAAAAVVAEAAAIAAAANAHLAAEHRAHAEQAAQTAHQAVVLAAARVSRAAEAAREAQATAEALAADDVASLARSTAAELRSRADELAVMVSAAASEAAPNAHGIGTDPTSSRLSDEAADAAAANARETENAAHIVADAVAQAAATVAATTAATAAAKQQEVADAAAAVRILAEAAARNIAAATQGAGPLDAHFDVDSATRRIAVHGQLDAATAHHIAAAVAGLQIGDDGDITIELSDVTSMDLAGLGVIDCARATQTDRRQRLRVSGAGDRARELFALAALTDLLADPQL